MNNEPCHILLADDDEVDILLFNEAIKELEINSSLEIVNGGVQLMLRLANKDLFLPNLLFLDLNMPVKNGLACLKEIRSNALFNQMVVAIYSTSSSEKDIVETFLNGANMYIQKPNDFNTLKKILEKSVILVNKREIVSNRDNFLLQV
jgi:CheY-like chemotaxis protein